MKKRILSSILLALVMLSCNQKNKEEKTTEGQVIVKTEEKYSCPMHPEVTGEKGDVCTICKMELEPVSTKAEEKIEEITPVSDAVKASVSTEDIINGYLKIKNALAKDNSKDAAAAATNFIKSVLATDAKKIETTLLTKYLNATDDAKNQARLIVTNSGKIDQQRMYFAVLSKDVTSLIATFGTNQKLYQDYCPMYNEGKSGYWISEIKDIQNPYYGSEMLTCGGMIKEIK